MLRRRFALAALVFLAAAVVRPAQEPAVAKPPDEIEAEKKAEEAAQAPKPAERDEFSDLVWIDPTDPRIDVRGLPFWDEQPGVWRRLPAADEDKYPKDVLALSAHLSGARLRLNCDATTFALHVKYPTLPAMRNMHAFGQAGIDVYLDGEYRSTLAPRKDTEVKSILFADAERSPREIAIYLPLYLGVEEISIGIDAEAAVSPAAPFAVEKPVVFYGTSITQGGCASRPGMSYQAMLERRLGVDFVNMGFSGAGRAQPEVVPHIARIDAALFVVDMGPNNPTPESALESVQRLLSALRDAQPDVPIIVTTPLYMTYELPGSNRPGNLVEMRQAIRDEVAARQAAGDANLRLVEGFSMIGPERGDGFVDGVHPNDLGFLWMADGLEGPIREMLGLNK